MKYACKLCEKAFEGDFRKETSGILCGPCYDIVYARELKAFAYAPRLLVEYGPDSPMELAVKKLLSLRCPQCGKEH